MYSLVPKGAGGESEFSRRLGQRPEKGCGFVLLFLSLLDIWKSIPQQVDLFLEQLHDYSHMDQRSVHLAKPVRQSFICDVWASLYRALPPMLDIPDILAQL